MYLRMVAGAAALMLLAACNGASTASRSAGAPGTAASDSDVSSAAISRGTRLRYPPKMLDLGIEGVADVSCDVSVQGTTSGCKVIRIAGPTDFGIAALDYVRQARYRPAMKNGIPIATQHKWTITFKLGPVFAPPVEAFHSPDWQLCLGPVSNRTGQDVADACNRVIDGADVPMPVKAAAYRMLGQTSAALHHDDLAIANFTKAIDLGDNPVDLYRLRGNVFLEQRDFARAAADFGFLAKISPNDAQALYAHAEASIGLGDLVTAERDLDMAITTRPDDPSLYILRASLRLAPAGQDAVLTDLDAALRLNATEVQALRARCDLYRKMGKPAAGDADCAAADALDPKRKVADALVP